MPTIFIVESFGGKKSSQLIPNVAISRENNVRQFHECILFRTQKLELIRLSLMNTSINFFPPIDSIFKYSILKLLQPNLGFWVRADLRSHFHYFY